MILQLTFDQLVAGINDGTVPKWLVQHAFADVDKLADELQKNKVYTATGPGGEQVEIRWSDD